MVGWINSRFGVHLAEEELTEVKNFSLIWNIFEDTVCNRNCNVPSIKGAYQNISFEIRDFEIFLLYFQSRYVENGVVNYRFPYLKIANKNDEEFVKNVLLGQIRDSNEIVIALTIIIYRYRNNLFHGEKDIRTINAQGKNFQHANNFLQTLLTKYFN